MKKHIVWTCLAIIFPLIAFSQEEFYTADPAKVRHGVIIMPMAEMNLPQEVVSSLEQQKTKGYSYKASNDAIDMLNSNRKKYLNEINNIADPTDTHMKSDFSKIKLAFKFKPISYIHSLGYAVGGMYIRDAGWTAISTFFNDNKIGACRYKLNNMRLSNGSVRIPKETVRYDVNNKVTGVFVEGSARSGFVYNVNWDDETYNHFLECANMKYDKCVTLRMIELARRIDKSVMDLKG